MGNNLITSPDGGVAYAINTKTAFISETAKPFVTIQDPPLTSSRTWAQWYDDNNDEEPVLIKDDIKHCPVLSAGIEANARLAVGKGLQPFLLYGMDGQGNEDLEWVSDTEVQDWLEANDSFRHSYLNVYNMLGYGWASTQLIFNKGRNKINRIQATDVNKARLSIKENGIIKTLQLYGDWSKAASHLADIKKVKILEEFNELEQVQGGVNDYECCMLHRMLKDGYIYYPPPMHRTASEWVKISRSIPQIKNSSNEHMMQVKYIILISDNYWNRIYKEKWNAYSAEERKTIIDSKRVEINNYLAGKANQGKSIIAGKYVDQYTGKEVNDISIEVLDDKIKDGKMLPDSAASDKQILFSMFTNPAIFGSNLLGDGASGGAGSGSDIREATLVLMQLLHPERQQNARIYNLVKNFNGWNKRLEVATDVFAATDAPQNNKRAPKTIPRLVFKYPNTILTTLDSGKSTKGVTN